MSTIIKKEYELLNKEADLNAWYVFNTFRGDTYVKGIKIMLGIGEPSPNEVFYQFIIYTKDNEYAFTKKTSSSLLKSNPGRLDISFKDLCKISGAWPKYKVFAREPINDITAELEFTVKSVQYWNSGKAMKFIVFGVPKEYSTYYSAYHCETEAHFEIQNCSPISNHIWASVV